MRSVAHRPADRGQRPHRPPSLAALGGYQAGCVVVVRGAENAAKEIAAELAKYAARPAPDAVLVLTHAGGAKGKTLITDLTRAGARVIECPKLTRLSEPADFVRAEFRRAGAA